MTEIGDDWFLTDAFRSPAGLFECAHTAAVQKGLDISLYVHTSGVRALVVPFHLFCDGAVQAYHAGKSLLRSVTPGDCLIFLSEPLEADELAVKHLENSPQQSAGNSLAGYPADLGSPAALTEESVQRRLILVFEDGVEYVLDVLPLSAAPRSSSESLRGLPEGKESVALKKTWLQFKAGLKK